ncbi:HEAT repeat domain-containing protein [Candidatus Micrarchaeota archaeon]|nr:HEAT repeat domain-containing protein [Candidatus Micrarchaeota archaeon]
MKQKGKNRTNGNRKITKEPLVDEGKIEKLIKDLKTGNTYWGHEAVVSLESLVKIGCPVLKYLIEVLKDGNEDVKINVIDALGRIGDPEAVPALIEVFKMQNDLWVGGWILDTTYNLKKKAVAALKKIIEKNPEETMEILIEYLQSYEIKYLAEKNAPAYTKILLGINELMEECKKGGLIEAEN